MDRIGTTEAINDIVITIDAIDFIVIPIPKPGTHDVCAVRAFDNTIGGKDVFRICRGDVRVFTDDSIITRLHIEAREARVLTDPDKIVA